jgi:hypothetical protein
MKETSLKDLRVYIINFKILCNKSALIVLRSNNVVCITIPKREQNKGFFFFY